MRQFMYLSIAVLCLMVSVLIGFHLGSRNAQAEDVLDTISAREFVLVDDEGKKRGSWTTNPDGLSGIMLLDRQGQKCMTLGLIRENNPAVVIFDEDGDPRSMWYYFSENKSVMFSLLDGQERPRLMSDVAENGYASITLYDSDQTERAALSLIPDDQAFLSFRKNGEITLGDLGDAGIGMSLFDPQKELRGWWTLNDDRALLCMYGKTPNSNAISVGELIDGDIGITLLDHQKAVRGMWRVRKDLKTNLNILDTEGNIRTVLGNASLTVRSTGGGIETAESSLVLYDKEGVVLQSIPCELIPRCFSRADWMDLLL